MKLIQEKRRKIESVNQLITNMEQYIVYAYLVCMLGIFPLFYKEQYYKIGDVKFEFFWKSSIYFIGGSLVIILIKAILREFGGQDLKKEKNPISFLENLSFLDFAVLVYAICVVLSYAFSDFKEFAFGGAAGWQMGLCSQMFFVAIYFILSRQNVFGTAIFPRQDSAKQVTCSKQRKFGVVILIIHLTASALTFIFGILHRFEVDPLGMYEGLELYQKVEFLSTIGQATWFSSYVCTVFAVGVILFYICEKRWIRIMSGIYSIISFGILVTQNSDSAFVAIAGILLLLGYFSLSDIKKWCRFWEILSLMWGTFAGMGILQKVFVDRAIPLDTLSLFFSQSPATWLMFAISLMLMLLYRYYNKESLQKKCNSERIMHITKSIYKSFLVMLFIGIVAAIIFIYLNTKGYLLAWFGYQNTHPYLFFDYHWGSNRGSTWMICWQVFMQMPMYQKLFGIGPDSLWAYLYSMPDMSEFLNQLWGNLQLTNAHNEYLNSLLCYGIVGVISWLSVLVGGICYFYKKAKNNSFMIAFALCIIGYACHNIFCYQQVCCTPFLFIVLGIGESLTKSENFNTIK